MIFAPDLGGVQDWGKYTSDVLDMYLFRENIVSEGERIWQKLPHVKPYVSVHFRRSDYLVMASLNLNLDYYREALQNFDREKYTLLVFSDDIGYCKQLDIFAGWDVYFASHNSAAVDMYLMSKCENHIIANSSFSFWGAFLSKRYDNHGLTICPYSFLGSHEDTQNSVNGYWYPDDWKAIHV